MVSSFAFVSSTICSLALYSSSPHNSFSSSYSSSSSSSSTVPITARLPTLRTNIYNNDNAMTFSTTEPCNSTTNTNAISGSMMSSKQSKQQQQALAELQQRTVHMIERAAQGLPFTEEEIQGILYSIQNVNPVDHDIDYVALKQLLQNVAHVSHKNWTVTEANAIQLGKILFQNGDMSTPAAHQMLERIVTEGNWDAAAAHHTETGTTTDEKPFAVLVTGVNGIRKTSSMYQPWFADLLQEALVAPSSSSCTTESSPGSFATSDLPTGHNSFFRQLDHMIATLINTEFVTLYRLTSQMLLQDNEQYNNKNNSNNTSKDNKEADAATTTSSSTTTISPAVIQAYSNYKAALFTRYRTVSELLGATLLQQAKLVRSNCLMETSGRDVAMFHYVDHFFNDTDKYHKLALHFQINDLRYAQDSVDQRMKDEIVAGIKAIQTGDAFDVIQANAGGPYGSEVLPDVQMSSDCVWHDIILQKNSTGVGHDWYKATIVINAHETEPWTAQAVKPDGSLGKEYVFEPLKRSL